MQTLAPVLTLLPLHLEAGCRISLRRHPWSPHLFSVRVVAFLLVHIEDLPGKPRLSSVDGA